MNQIHLGPEAGRLIAALQEFISSIVVHSQLGAQNAIIDVSLDESTSYALIICAINYADAIYLPEEQELLRNNPEEDGSDPDDEEGMLNS